MSSWQHCKLQNSEWDMVPAEPLLYNFYASFGHVPVPVVWARVCLTAEVLLLLVTVHEKLFFIYFFM